MVGIKGLEYFNMGFWDQYSIFKKIDHGQVLRLSDYFQKIKLYDQGSFLLILIRWFFSWSRTTLLDHTKIFPCHFFNFFGQLLFKSSRQKSRFRRALLFYFWCIFIFFGRTFSRIDVSLFNQENHSLSKSQSKFKHTHS